MPKMQDFRLHWREAEKPFCIHAQLMRNAKQPILNARAPPQSPRNARERKGHSPPAFPSTGTPFARALPHGEARAGRPQPLPTQGEAQLAPSSSPPGRDGWVCRGLRPVRQGRLPLAKLRGPALTKPASLGGQGEAAPAAAGSTVLSGSRTAPTNPPTSALPLPSFLAEPDRGETHCSPSGQSKSNLRSPLQPIHV